MNTVLAYLQEKADKFALRVEQLDTDHNGNTWYGIVDARGNAIFVGQKRDVSGFIDGVRWTLERING